MADVRKKVEDFLKQLPETGEVTSSVGGKTDDKAADNIVFTNLTGMTHSGLKTTWATEKTALDEKLRLATEKNGKPLTPMQISQISAGSAHTTSCNGLTGKVGQVIGSTIALGQFFLATNLPKAGLGEAWIPATGGNRPKLGDVFKMKKFHVGVSVTFDGDTWHTAEAGQGGATRGCDAVKRKTQPWNPAILEGWCDIEILMQLLGAKVPAWMQGWWRFEIAEKKEFVFFPDRGRAISVDTAPLNAKTKPASGRSGSLTIEDGNHGVIIEWSPSTTDTLGQLAALDYMLGKRASQQIQAYKMK